MKMISEHLGRIIATLAAIAVVIGVITCYRADLGEFFMNVISGEQRIADGVLGNMGDFDLNGDYQGPDLTTDQALGSSSDNPLGVESSSFTLSGTVTDESGVASLTVNGTNVTVADDGTWSTTLTLTQNVATEVTVVATDSEGNETKKTGYVRYIVYKPVYVGKNNYYEHIGYNHSVTDLVIPATFEVNGTWYKVIGILSNGFANCTNLESVVIPDSVTYIGDYAFERCTNLSTVIFGENIKLTVIDEDTFYGCTNLESVDIPDSVTQIKNRAFCRCSRLSNVNFSKNSQLVSIGFLSFGECTSLTSVTIPESVCCIDKEIFRNCTNLSNVTFKNTDGWYVTNIEGATSGDNVDVTNTSANVTNLKSTYQYYYWYRSVSE